VLKALLASCETTEDLDARVMLLWAFLSCSIGTSAPWTSAHEVT
jgi:hypothetical protein